MQHRRLPLSIVKTSARQATLGVSSRQLLVSLRCCPTSSITLQPFIHTKITSSFTIPNQTIGLSLNSYSTTTTAITTTDDSNVRPPSVSRKDIGSHRRRFKRPQSSQEFISATASSIDVLLSRITNLSPGDYYHRVGDVLDRTQLTNFSRLHTALQDPNNAHAIWDAYYVIRRSHKDLRLLSNDVIRLLIIYFKDAAKKCNPNEARCDHISVNDEIAYKGVNSAKEIWHARIVTVINDKRSLAQSLTRWDFSDLMSALNGVGRFEEALDEFKKLIAGNVKVDPILLNHAVRAWGGLNRLDIAAKVIHEARKRFNIKPSEFTLGYLIQKCLIAGYKKEALGFWKEMLADESLESIETVNGILRACVASRESLYAQEVYDTLPRLGIDSNIESLDLMLSLAVAEIQYPSDRSLFLQAVHEKMISSEKPVFDQRILKSILTSFAKKGDADGAILAKGLIGNYGCVPRVNEYNSILHCYIRLREMDKAIDWLQEMRRSGVRPDRSTYVLLMQSFAQQRMPRHAEALFRQLLRDGIQPDLAVCNYLLMAYEQGRMERRCLQLYKSMLNDRSIGVDQISFTCMFNAIFHSDKARLEGGEGLQGEGTVLNDLRFLNKISEPIGQSFRPTLENDGSRTISTSAAPSRPSSNPCIVKKHYQFDKIPSTTEFLNPRTLFRDMIIVGIRPSRSLYSNILRAFFAWHDYAGATVALQALIDHYSLKPTPKMNAIVVSWVLEEHNRRNDNNENTPISKGELSKLVNMMSRTRGLIQILEKLAYDQNYGQDFKTEKNMDNLAPISLSPEDNTTTTVTGPRANSRIGFPPQNQGQIANQIEAAKMEMGGDLLELFSTSPIAGSSWSTKKDDPTQIDLNDFERWFQLYSTRASYDRSRKSKDVST